MCSRQRTTATALLLLLAVEGLSALPVAPQRTPVGRNSLVTKHNVHRLYGPREKKSAGLAVPRPVVVTTRLAVGTSEADRMPDDGSRRGRSYFDEDGNAVVEGVRVPDDETDVVTWRNGRVINNVFVPNGQAPPAEVVVTGGAAGVSGKRTPRMTSSVWGDSAFNYDRHYEGRTADMSDSVAMESRTAEVAVRPDGSHARSGPVYYLPDEPDSLHADRSPYDFEPADARPRPAGSQKASASPASSYAKPGDFADLGLGGASAPADSNDFVIKQHSYTMCAGCPTFSIPIPVPKSTLRNPAAAAAAPPRRQQFYHQDGGYYAAEDDVQEEEGTFLGRIGSQISSTFRDVKTSAMEMLHPIMKLAGIDGNYLESGSGSSVLESKIGGAALSAEPEQPAGNYALPVIFGGMAAAALGVFAAATTFNIPASARSLAAGSSPLQTEQEQDDVLRGLKEAEEKYGSSD